MKRILESLKVRHLLRAVLVLSLGSVLFACSGTDDGDEGDGEGSLNLSGRSSQVSTSVGLSECATQVLVANGREDLSLLSYDEILAERAISDDATRDLIDRALEACQP